MISTEDKLFLKLKYDIVEYTMTEYDYVILYHIIPDKFFIDNGYDLPLQEKTVIIVKGGIPLFYANLLTWSKHDKPRCCKALNSSV